LLERLTAELVNELGPVAHCVVQRAAARGDHNEAALLMRVANDALPASRRGAFIERMRALMSDKPGAAPRGPATHPPTGVVLPVLNEVLGEAPNQPPLNPRLLHDAQRLMTLQVGPLAALLVRRAAAGAATREQFIARLAGLAAEGREREKIFAALCRLP
jgi:serine/threonine-protein kinase